MKKMAAFFQHKATLSFIGVLALCILVWFVGPLISFGKNHYQPMLETTPRLLFILVLVVLWGLNNLRQQQQKKKQNDELVEEIVENNQDEYQALGDEEVSALSTRFSEAMAQLKLNRKNKGKKSLYDMPWYIIVGPPGSGKTTALVNSGLEFPLAKKFGKEALRGVGGTRDCDWWFTDDAVLIDTAGRYTTQDSHKEVDASAWQGFLQLLRKHRRRRPINGAIVAISIQDILLSTHEQRMQHARTIRNRLDELGEQLGLNVPVYLLFTKCDLLAGFSEFFADFNHADRNQVWGVTASNSDDLLGRFETSFAQLHQRINEQMLERMHQERDLRRRSLIQGFPQQFGNLQEQLTAFIDQAFTSNKYSQQPDVRGLYLSSATQQGSPIDRMMSSISAKFSLDSAQMPTQQGQGRSYFIRNLFNEVIFPEADRVGVNKKYERWLNIGRKVSYTGLTLILAGIGSLWSLSYANNKDLMLLMQHSVESYDERSALLSEWKKDVSDVVPALNALARASGVFDKEEYPWLTGLGMYDDNLNQEAKKAYYNELQRLLLPRLAYQQEAVLNQISADDKGLYPALKSYLMLSDKTHFDLEYVNNWHTQYWRDTLSLKPQLQEELAVHLQVLLTLNFDPVKRNNQSVDRARFLISQQTLAQRLYEAVRNQPEYQNKVNFNSSISGPISRVLLTNNTKPYYVPYIYTKDAYSALDFSANSPLLKIILADNWIMGEQGASELSHSEMRQLARQAEHLYLQDYAKYWDKLLKELSIVKLQSTGQAIQMLDILSDPIYSPLSSLLQLTSEQTNLNPEIELAGKGKAAKLVSAGSDLFNGQTENLVDKKYKSIINLVKESDKAQAPIQATLGLIGDLHLYLQEMEFASDPQEAAFLAAQKRMAGSADPIKLLRLEAANLPEPVSNWLLSLADDSWQLVLNNAKSYIDSQWYDLVYVPYQQGISQRYPLSKGAREQVTLYDFGEYFREGGIEFNFVDEYLSSFVERRRQWKIKKVDGKGLAINHTSLKQMQRAENIRKTFFSLNPSSPSLSFDLKPLSLDARVQKFELDVNGQKFSYSHGPMVVKPVPWPGESEKQRARISFVDIDGTNHKRSYSGPWAMFKLLDDSSVKAARRINSYQVTFNKDKRDMAWEIRAKSVNNPFKGNLLSAYTCPKVL